MRNVKKNNSNNLRLQKVRNHSNNESRLYNIHCELNIEAHEIRVPACKAQDMNIRVKEATYRGEVLQKSGCLLDRQLSSLYP